MLLGPFGGAQESRLFAVPRAIDNGALRLPSGLDQLTKSPRFFDGGNLTRDGILRTVYPAVVMIATNHPFIRKSGTLNSSDHVINWLDVPARFHFQMNSRGAGTDVVGDAEAPAPSFRSHAAGQRREQRLRVRIGNRQNRNLGDRGSFFHLETLGVLGGANSRSEGVAWVIRHVCDASALHTIGWAEGAGGKCFALDEPVFVRIGEYEAADGAVFGGNLGLDAAPGVEVAGDDDLALHGNAHALELLVVFRDAVVDIDERSGDVAVDRVGVVSGELLGLLI